MLTKSTFLFFFYCSFSFTQQNFYVKPSGSDSLNGTSLGSAFKTLDKAREVINGKPRTQNIIINIESGIYILDSTLVFGEDDSGTGDFKITYKAIDSLNKPIISGGYYVDNHLVENPWVLHDSVNNIWSVNIGDNYSRQVYLNGQKIKRARSEDADDLIETTTGYFSFCHDFSSWENIQDVEVVSNVEWRSNRIPVESACENQLIIKEDFWRLVHHDYQDKSTNFQRAKPVWIENAFELMDLPNEWYIDRSEANQYILYIKTNNNQVAPENVVVPLLEKLITGSNVTNVEFDGLVFRHTSWLGPSNKIDTTQINQGLVVRQADVHIKFKPNVVYEGNRSNLEFYHQIPGALSFEFSNSITIKNCKFEHLGSAGLEFLEGSKENTISKNEFLDISASAISIGANRYIYGDEANEDNDPKMVRNHTITKNLIKNIANDYFSGVGIFVSHARYSEIHNNKLENFPYSGISVGWGWNNHPTYEGINHISKNYIDCSSQILQDGGAIYTLSNQTKDSTSIERSNIHNNYILNHKIRYGAIYLDQGSSNINVYKNVIDVSEEEITGSYDDLVKWLSIAQSQVKGILVYDNYYRKDEYPEYLAHPCSFISEEDCNSIIINTSNNPFVTPDITISTIKNNAGP